MPEDEMIIPTDDTVVENTNTEEAKDTVEDTNVEPPTFIEDIKDDTEDSEGDPDSDDSGEDSKDDGGQDDAKIDEPPVKPQTPEKVEEAQDPGDFQPQDYSYDVTLADGQVIRISKPEDIKNIPTDAQFESPQALFEASAKYTKMVNGIDADKRAYEADKEKYESETKQREDNEKYIQTTIAEMNYLETKGRLPKYDTKYDSMDWNDPEVAKQPGIKERVELLDYRSKANDERRKLGLSDMSLIEAQMQMAQEARDTAETAKKNKQAEIRKTRGSMVGGNTQSEIGDPVDDDFIIGEGGHIRDIS